MSKSIATHPGKPFPFLPNSDPPRKSPSAAPALILDKEHGCFQPQRTSGREPASVSCERKPGKSETPASWKTEDYGNTEQFPQISSAEGSYWLSPPHQEHLDAVTTQRGVQSLERNNLNHSYLYVNNTIRYCIQQILQQYTTDTTTVS